MPRIAEIARQRGAIVIEDACHAIGSEFEYQGSKYRVGGHPWADMTILSFHPVKTMTTGEGGAILTDSDTYAQTCRLLRSHGVIKDPACFVGLSDTNNDAQFSEKGAWYYEMPQLGFNYRITDFQCALGLSQLRKLDGFIQRRVEIVAAYNAAFASLPYVTTPAIANASIRPSRIAWHLYVMQFDFRLLGKTRTQVGKELHNLGIGWQVHYIPVHLQPYYRRRYGYALGKCPIAEAYYRSCLSLPLYPAMTDVDVKRVVEAVISVIGT
jgi:dTDP-4-amino-4,6-dideoxygalactose transaminase